jgi:hypothetical protein
MADVAPACEPLVDNGAPALSILDRTSKTSVAGA